MTISCSGASGAQGPGLNHLRVWWPSQAVVYMRNTPYFGLFLTGSRCGICSAGFARWRKRAVEKPHPGISRSHRHLCSRLGKKEKKKEISWGNKISPSVAAALPDLEHLQVGDMMPVQVVQLGHPVISSLL